MIRNVRVTGRTEQDRVKTAQGIDPILRHHLAMLSIIVAAPGEMLEIQLESGIAGRKGFENLNTGINYFRPNAITGDGCNFVFFHGSYCCGL